MDRTQSLQTLTQQCEQAARAYIRKSDLRLGIVSRRSIGDDWRMDPRESPEPTVTLVLDEHNDYYAIVDANTAMPYIAERNRVDFIRACGGFNIG